MVDRSPLEEQAFEAILPALAEVVAEIGKEKPLDHYSREEIQRIVEICVCEYQRALLKLLSEQPSHEEIPLSC
ncbi:hypothetical protein Cva_00671 [Caedimonas varicaedens]|uniref:Uncharacterized protein n=1 Tax=Caedimonas varicaedens TaxID=1629334 RepID=A0A0K8MCV4_9PROT|nr:hypothetical protein Cva_00671 [Caedimonas varicaedens]